MTIRIGTRGSALALWQAHFVRAALLRIEPDVEAEIVTIKTEGDLRRRARVAMSGSTGVFTKAIELALLDEMVDIAVHSLKDLPTTLSEGLTLAAVPRREDPADGLVSKRDCVMNDLPEGAIILTGSPRRRAEILALRPDIEVRPVRGNVPTRLRKMRESTAHGVMLACAGLARMGMAHVASERMDPESFIPAPGQGALAVECREADTRVKRLCESIDDAEARLAVTAERAFMRTLKAGCRVPAGAYGFRKNPEEPLRVVGLVAEPDGTTVLRDEVEGEVDEREDARELGCQLAESLKEKGCEKILERVRGEAERGEKA